MPYPDDPYDEHGGNDETNQQSQREKEGYTVGSITNRTDDSTILPKADSIEDLRRPRVLPNFMNISDKLTTTTSSLSTRGGNAPPKSNDNEGYSTSVIGDGDPIPFFPVFHPIRNQVVQQSTRDDNLNQESGGTNISHIGATLHGNYTSTKSLPTNVGQPKQPIHDRYGHPLYYPTIHSHDPAGNQEIHSNSQQHHMTSSMQHDSKEKRLRQSISYNTSFSSQNNYHWNPQWISDTVRPGGVANEHEGSNKRVKGHNNSGIRTQTLSANERPMINDDNPFDNRAPNLTANTLQITYDSDQDYNNQKQHRGLIEGQPTLKTFPSHYDNRHEFNTDQFQRLVPYSSGPQVPSSYEFGTEHHHHEYDNYINNVPPEGTQRHQTPTYPTTIPAQFVVARAPNMYVDLRHEPQGNEYSYRHNDSLAQSLSHGMDNIVLEVGGEPDNKYGVLEADRNSAYVMSQSQTAILHEDSPPLAVSKPLHLYTKTDDIKHQTSNKDISDHSTNPSESNNDNASLDKRENYAGNVTSSNSRNASAVLPPSPQHKKHARWSNRFTWPRHLHRDFASAVFLLGLERCNASTVLIHMSSQDPNVTRERVQNELDRYKRNKKVTSDIKSRHNKLFTQEQKDEDSTAVAGTVTKIGSPKNKRPLEELRSKGIHRYSSPSSEVATGKQEDKIVEPNETIIFNQLLDMHSVSSEETVLILPRLTDEEKKSKIGASMSYLMGLLFSLKQELSRKRDEAVGFGPKNPQSGYNWRP